MGNDLNKQRKWSDSLHHKQAPWPCKQFNLYKDAHGDILMVRNKCATTPMKEIYTFSRITNTWTKLIKFPNDFVKAYADVRQRKSSTHFFAAAYDESSQMLYLVKSVNYDMINKIFQLNLRNLQWKDITSNLQFKDSWAKFMFIDSKLHIVETSIFKRHILYEPTTNQWENCQILKHELVKKLVHHNYCYCKTKNVFYLFGSDTASYEIYNQTSNYVDTICAYNVVDDEWSHLNIDIPKEFHREFRIINTREDTVRLLVSQTKDIFVFDMEFNTIFKSKMKMHKGNFEIITVSNKSYVARLLKGYIAELDIGCVPKDIRNIIVSLVIEDYMHLVGYPEGTKLESKRKHLSINLDRILRPETN
eukprot:86602_1